MIQINDDGTGAEAEIQGAATRAARVAQQLLTFSRLDAGVEVQVSEVDVARLRTSSRTEILVQRCSMCSRMLIAVFW